MSPRKYFVVSIFLLLFISSTVYSKEMLSKDYLKDVKQEDKIDIDTKYKYQNDVFYPPEEYLAKQGMTLESYKQSLVDNAPRNRNSGVNNIWGLLH